MNKKKTSGGTDHVNVRELYNISSRESSSSFVSEELSNSNSEEDSISIADEPDVANLETVKKSLQKIKKKKT